MHVLLIEDTPILRLHYWILIGCAGHQITACTNGAAGILALTRGTFDAVVTDLQMHPGSGLDVLLYLKSEPTPPRTLLHSEAGEWQGEPVTAVVAAFPFAEFHPKDGDGQYILEFLTRVAAARH